MKLQRVIPLGSLGLLRCWALTFDNVDITVGISRPQTKLRYKEKKIYVEIWIESFNSIDICIIVSAGEPEFKCVEAHYSLT